MRPRYLLLGVLVLFLPCRAALAGEVNLPGHALSDKDASAKASIVFLGQLVDLNATNARGEYVAKVIYVHNPANGIHPYRTSQNTTVHIPAIPSDLSFPVVMTVAANETAPQVGKTYVFYAKDNTRPHGAGYDAIKLAPTGERGEGVRAF